MKKYFISIFISLILILISALIINIFYYYDLFNNNIYKIILIITSYLIIGTSSFILGKKIDKKGYLEGLKFGIIISIVLFLLSLILFKNINIGMLIYYPTIIISSIIGSMIGINTKKNNN